MDLKLIFDEAHPDIVVFLLTTLTAFIAWLMKSLIEKPISESKNTFNNFFKTRIEISSEIKTRLNLIAYFPSGKENLEYKEQLQNILLKDGRVAYLDREIFDIVLYIAISPNTDEKLLIETIKKIDDDLYSQITKVQDEISFYRKFSNYKPIKRFVGFTMLSLQYVASFSLIIFTLFSLIWLFLNDCVIFKIIAVVIVLIGLFFTNKWLKK